MHSYDFLPTVVILLLAAVFIVAVFKHVKISPVLGFLGAGIAIGPHALGIVKAEDVQGIAEYGVVFLLFTIGLELTIDRLLTMRLHVFGFGTVQVLLTALLIGGIIMISGRSINEAIIIGGALSLSSTAIVLQVLQETGRKHTQVGRLSLAVLLLQDFAVVPLLVLVPLLAKNSAHIGIAISNALLNAVLAMILILGIGRVLMRPIFRYIGSLKSDDLFVATTLLIVLGAAALTDHFGLSLALGAFLAGLLVGETEFLHQVEDTIMPFKGILLGLFFMSVGMNIDLYLLVDKLPEVFVYAFLLIILKAGIIAGICLLFSFPIGSAIHAGLILSQAGEFGFVLFGLALNQQLIPTATAHILMVVVTISMALTPLLALIGGMIGDRLERDKNQRRLIAKINEDLDSHVIIAGFGRVGQMVAELLQSERLSYVALDVNAVTVEEAAKEGYAVVRGDCSHIDTLRLVRADRAIAVIVTVENYITLKKTLQTINAHIPDMPIVVRTQDMKHAKELYRMGATIIVPETYETGLQLGSAVLKALGITETEVTRLQNRFRSGEYARSEEAITAPNEG